MAGGVRVPVEEHERVLPAVDDETFFVVAFGCAAKDAPLLLIGAGDDSSRHGAQSCSTIPRG